MYSKFLVLSKFYKHLNIKQFSLIRLSNRRNYAKNRSDVVIPEGKNKILLDKNSTNFEISRNMSSNNNNNNNNIKGENENKDNIHKDKLKLKQKLKRKFYRRRYKLKMMKALQEKKLFNKQRELNKTKFIPKLNESKVEMPRPVSDPSFLPPRLPPKQVHVEFMESKNLKDFDLNRSSFYQPYDTLNVNKSVIDIKIKPLLLSSRVSDNQNKLLFSGEKKTNSQLMDSNVNLIKITDNVTKEVAKSDENTLTNSINNSKETRNNQNKLVLSGGKKTNSQLMDSNGNLIKITDNVTKEVAKSDENILANSTNKSRNNQNKLVLSGEKKTNSQLVDSNGNLIKLTNNVTKEVAKSDKNTLANSTNNSKETQKDVSNNIIEDRNTESKIATKNTALSSDIKSSTEDNVSKLNNILPKKTENIRILYQTHPKRKTKIRTPKRIESKNVKSLESKTDQHLKTENEIATKTTSFSSEIKSSTEDNISKPNNILPKKTANIRVLYKAHPKRKPKIKIRKHLESEKIKILETKTAQAKKESVRKSTDEPDEPFKRHEFLDIKMKSNNYRSNISKPSATIEKGILYPTENANKFLKSSVEEVRSNNKNKNKLLPNIDAESLKVPMKKVESKVNKEIKPNLSREMFLPNNPKYILNSIIKQKDKITENPKNTKRKDMNKLVLPTPANKNKINFNPSSYGIKNKNPSLPSQSNKNIVSSKSSTDSIQTNKLNLSAQPNKNNIGSKSSTTSVANKLKGLEIKNDLNTINRFSTGSKSTATASDLKNKDAGTIKTNKLTKFKRSRRSNSRGGRSGGDDGDKTKSNNTIKARPSRFWRTISISILPLIFGLTIYTMSNVEFVDMFKRIRDGHFGEDPLNMKILPTFYGRRSKSEQEVENDNPNDNNNDDDDIEDPKFDEV